MRTVRLSERVPAPDVGGAGAALAAALAGSYLALLVAAIEASPVLFLGAGLLVTGLEVAVGSRAPFLGWLANRVGAGASWRGLLRLLAVFVLIARSESPPAWLLAAALGVLLLGGVRAVAYVLATLVTRQRKVPVVTRGLSLAPLRIPPAPHPLVARYLDETLGVPDAVVLAAAAAAVLGDSLPVLQAGMAIAGASLVVSAAVLARAALAMRSLDGQRMTEAVTGALRDEAPQVALYAGGGPETLYQLEMWVETVERLHVPAVVIVRDRDSLRQLGPTRLPVVCVEHGTVLMALPLPSLRLALYVSHATTNLHLLRRRGVRHVFVGHGDSDKSVTTNPFLKAYDEVWVSGPAARERFAAAGLGLEESRIVEIGRPQLDGLAEVPRADPPRPLTVLYAPTWEGYDDERHQSSLGPCGVAAVRELLTQPDVRVVYRPHPLAGTRDRSVLQAHREILALLGAGPAPEPVAPTEAYASARDDLDVAAASVVTSRSDQVAASDLWAGEQLAPRPAATPEGSPHLVAPHVVAPAPQFSLYACFAAADVLLCDVSSVITDFLAVGRPYAVTNPAGLDRDEFAARYPSTRGGYLVGADGQGLDAILAAGRGGADPAAPERVALRDQLLGPSEPPALERMGKAVAACCTFSQLEVH
jgi:hypothetical protein